MRDNSNTTLVLGLIVIILIIIGYVYGSKNQLFTKIKQGNILIDTKQDAVHSTTSDEQWEAAEQLEKEQNTQQ